LLLFFSEKPSEIVIQRVGDAGQDDILASAGISLSFIVSFFFISLFLFQLNICLFAISLCYFFLSFSLNVSILVISLFLRQCLSLSPSVWMFVFALFYNSFLPVGLCFSFLGIVSSRWLFVFVVLFVIFLFLFVFAVLFVIFLFHLTVSFCSAFCDLPLSVICLSLQCFLWSFLSVILHVNGYVCFNISKCFSFLFRGCLSYVKKVCLNCVVFHVH